MGKSISFWPLSTRGFPQPSTVQDFPLSSLEWEGNNKRRRGKSKVSRSENRHKSLPSSSSKHRSRRLRSFAWRRRRNRGEGRDSHAFPSLRLGLPSSLPSPLCMQGRRETENGVEEEEEEAFSLSSSTSFLLLCRRRSLYIQPQHRVALARSSLCSLAGPSSSSPRPKQSDREKSKYGTLCPFGDPSSYYYTLEICLQKSHFSAGEGLAKPSPCAFFTSSSFAEEEESG